MVNAEEIDMWECSTCGYEYEDEYEAENCCPNSADSVSPKWRCEECEELYDEEEEANKCCTKEVKK